MSSPFWRPDANRSWRRNELPRDALARRTKTMPGGPIFVWTQCLRFQACLHLIRTNGRIVLISGQSGISGSNKVR